MKILLLISIYTFSFFYLYSQIQTPACGDWIPTSWPSIQDCDKFEYGDWVLVFNDEFDGNIIDDSKWYTLMDGWNPVHGDELQYYLDENVILEDGKLKLTAKYEPGYYDVWHEDENGNWYISQEYYEYTSGMIQSKMKFLYGVFEISCKIPIGKGYWPAYWYFQGGPGNISNEIDIFEFGGSDPYKHHMNLRKWVDGDVEVDCRTHQYYNIDFSEDFHTFSIEWDEFKIVYRVDGITTRIDYHWFNMVPHGLYECEDHSPGYYTFNPNFPDKTGNFILNLAISHGPFGGPPNEFTVFPQALEVEYVRFYRRKNPTRNVTICNFDFINESNAITGKTISVGGASCQPILNNNNSIFLFAEKNIVLKQGFHAMPGCNFKANMINGGEMKFYVNKDSIGYSSLKNTIIDTVLFDEIGQSDTISNESFQIYPNPTSGNFNIEINLSIIQPYRLEIYDIKGNVVFFKEIKFPISNDVISVNFTDKQKGIYICKLILSENSIHEKLILK